MPSVLTGVAASFSHCTRQWTSSHCFFVPDIHLPFALMLRILAAYILQSVHLAKTHSFTLCSCKTKQVSTVHGNCAQTTAGQSQKSREYMVILTCMLQSQQIDQKCKNDQKRNLTEKGLIHATTQLSLSTSATQ